MLTQVKTTFDSIKQTGTSYEKKIVKAKLILFAILCFCYIVICLNPFDTIFKQYYSICLLGLGIVLDVLLSIIYLVIEVNWVNTKKFVLNSVKHIQSKTIRYCIFPKLLIVQLSLGLIFNALYFIVVLN